MTTPAEPDLKTRKWEMTITRDIDHAQHKFNFEVLTQAAKQLSGNILNSDGSKVPFTGFYLLGPVTSPFALTFRFNIDGVIVMLSGVADQAKPTDPATFEGFYQRIGRSTFGVTAFDPGETGTGGGQQTT